MPKNKHQRIRRAAFVATRSAPEPSKPKARSYELKVIYNHALHQAYILLVKNYGYDALYNEFSKYPLLHKSAYINEIPVVLDSEGRYRSLFHAIIEHPNLTYPQKESLIDCLFKGGDNYCRFYYWLLQPRHGISPYVYKHLPQLVYKAYEIHLRGTFTHIPLDHQTIWNQLIKNNDDKQIANILYWLKRRSKMVGDTIGFTEKFIQLWYSKCNTLSEVKALSKRLRSFERIAINDLITKEEANRQITHLETKEIKVETSKKYSKHLKKSLTVVREEKVGEHHLFLSDAKSESFAYLKKALSTLPSLSRVNQHLDTMFITIANAIASNSRLSSKEKSEILIQLCRTKGYTKWEFILVKSPFLELFENKLDLINKYYSKLEASEKAYVWDLVINEKISPVMSHLFNLPQEGLEFLIYLLNKCKNSKEVIQLKKVIEPLLPGTKLASSHAEIIKMCKLRSLTFELTLQKEIREAKEIKSASESIEVETFLGKRIKTFWTTFTKNMTSSSLKIYKKIKNNNLETAKADITKKEMSLIKSFNSKQKTKIHFKFNFEKPTFSKPEEKEEKVIEAPFMNVHEKPASSVPSSLDPTFSILKRPRV